MPIVFVHGVNTRKGQSYTKGIQKRSLLLNRYVIPEVDGLSEDTEILNPYWGEYGANPRWEFASLPDSAEAFDAESDNGVTQSLLAETNICTEEEIENPICSIARESFPNAVDVLVATLLQNNADSVDSIMDFTERAIAYAENIQNPDWLDRIESDSALLKKLAEEVKGFNPPNSNFIISEVEEFGLTEIMDKLREAASRIKSSASNLATKGVVSLARAPLHKTIAIFMGDVFVYLDQRGTKENPGKIPQKIIASLNAAKDKKTDNDEKIILIGHSLGGVILYDVLTHFFPEYPCDLLITVGSQVGLFEELKLYRESQESIPGPDAQRVPKIVSADRWINVFDKNDVLSFSTDKIFENVEDYSYSSGTGMLKSHGMYFERPSFYKRLAERI